MAIRVVIGLVGSTLDAGKGPNRWNRWRPSVALCQHEDLLVDRFELLYQPRAAALANTIVGDIRSVSPETDVQLHEIDFDDAWDFEEVYGALLDFVRGYDFRPRDHEYLVHITTGTHVCQICTFLLTESNYIPGKLVQTAPPRKKTAGPGTHRIIDLDLSKYDTIAQRFEGAQREGLSFLKAGIDTRNRRFNALVEEIEHVSVSSTAPILLTGPTGAGKSKLARRIHDLKSQRRQVEGRFVEVNCATLRGDQAMSALFGHRKGAFTGAINDRPGLLQSAHDGLLFLDEIGELGLDEQAMLLRAIEEKRFLPVGADREVESDFQLIAGTNRDLGRGVSTGSFRDDLLSRINLWTFELPGLAERREDIEPNIEYELTRFAKNTGTNVQFNREAARRFSKWSLSADATWMGNFRDLNAAVTRMATLAPAGRITVREVDAEIERLLRSWRSTAGAPAADSLVVQVLGVERADDLDRFERVQLEDVLEACRDADSLSGAGRTLFAVTRTRRKVANDADRLRKYLAKFDLEWKAVRSEL